MDRNTSNIYLKGSTFDHNHLNAACTGNGGEAGDYVSHGTCSDGKVCSPNGNCLGKHL